MHLESCCYCFCLPLLGQLPTLKELFISRMEFLMTLGPELCGQPFPSLEKLEFSSMVQWEEWVPNASGGQCSLDFPCLKELIIIYCLKLRGSLPLPRHLPCVKKFKVPRYGALHDQWATTTSTSLNMDSYKSLDELEIYDGRQTGLSSLLETKLMSLLNIHKC